MQTRVQKLDDDLVVNIPDSFAKKLQLSSGSVVEIVLVDDKIIISPKEQLSSSLDHLLAAVTADNMHEEVDTGNVVGNELI